MSIVVMAHPDRAENARHLAEQLSARIVWDRGEGHWDTARRAWSLASDEWHCVIQDDAHVADNLAGNLPRIALGVPVSLYWGTGRPNPHISKTAAQAATRTGASWITGPGPWWAVGLVLPSEHVPHILDHAKTRPGGDDTKIASWYARWGIDCWYTWPSLVDHQPGPSILHPSDKTRRIAHSFLEDANLYDPGGPVVSTNHLHPSVFYTNGTQIRPVASNTAAERRLIREGWTELGSM